MPFPHSFLHPVVFRSRPCSLRRMSFREVLMDASVFASGSQKQDPSTRELHHALIVDSSPEINQLLTNLFDHADWSILCRG